MSRIWDSFEYKLSDNNLQHWATCNDYVRFDLTQYFPDMFGKSLALKINTNVGLINVNVKLKISFTNVFPELPMDKDKYMVKGKSSLGKRSIFFTRNCFFENPVISDLVKQLNALEKKLQDEHFLYVKKHLINELAASAKIALKDHIEELHVANRLDELREWFIQNNFINVPSVELFNKMKTFGNIPLKNQPDGYGHYCGSSIMIDWKNDKFIAKGWSSD